MQDTIITTDSTSRQAWNLSRITLQHESNIPHLHGRKDFRMRARRIHIHHIISPMSRTHGLGVLRVGRQDAQKKFLDMASTQDEPTVAQRNSEPPFSDKYYQLERRKSRC